MCFLCSIWGSSLLFWNQILSTNKKWGLSFSILNTPISLPWLVKQGQPVVIGHLLVARFGNATSLTTIMSCNNNSGVRPLPLFCVCFEWDLFKWVILRNLTLWMKGVVFLEISSPWNDKAEYAFWEVQILSLKSIPSFELQVLDLTPIILWGGKN